MSDNLSLSLSLFWGEGATKYSSSQIALNGDHTTNTPQSVWFRTAALYNYFIQHTHTNMQCCHWMSCFCNTPASYLASGSNLSLQNSYPEKIGFPKSLQAYAEIIPWILFYILIKWYPIIQHHMMLATESVINKWRIKK